MTSAPSQDDFCETCVGNAFYCETDTKITYKTFWGVLTLEDQLEASKFAACQIEYMKCINEKASYHFCPETYSGPQGPPCFLWKDYGYSKNSWSSVNLGANNNPICCKNFDGEPYPWESWDRWATGGECFIANQESCFWNSALPYDCDENGNCEEWVEDGECVGREASRQFAAVSEAFREVNDSSPSPSSPSPYPTAPLPDSLFKDCNSECAEGIDCSGTPAPYPDITEDEFATPVSESEFYDNLGWPEGTSSEYGNNSTGERNGNTTYTEWWMGPKWGGGRAENESATLQCYDGSNIVKKDDGTYACTCGTYNPCTGNAICEDGVCNTPLVTDERTQSSRRLTPGRCVFGNDQLRAFCEQPIFREQLLEGGDKYVSENTLFYGPNVPPWIYNVRNGQCYLSLDYCHAGNELTKAEADAEEESIKQSWKDNPLLPIIYPLQEVPASWKKNYSNYWKNLNKGCETYNTPDKILYDTANSCGEWNGISDNDSYDYVCAKQVDTSFHVNQPYVKGWNPLTERPGNWDVIDRGWWTGANPLINIFNVDYADLFVDLATDQFDALSKVFNVGGDSVWASLSREGMSPENRNLLLNETSVVWNAFSVYGPALEFSGDKSDAMDIKGTVCLNSETKCSQRYLSEAQDFILSATIGGTLFKMMTGQCDKAIGQSNLKDDDGFTGFYNTDGEVANSEIFPKFSAGANVEFPSPIASPSPSGSAEYYEKPKKDIEVLFESESGNKFTIGEVFINEISKTSKEPIFCNIDPRLMKVKQVFFENLSENLNIYEILTWDENAKHTYPYSFLFTELPDKFNKYIVKKDKVRYLSISFDDVKNEKDDLLTMIYGVILNSNVIRDVYRLNIKDKQINQDIINNMSKEELDGIREKAYRDIEVVKNFQNDLKKFFPKN